MTTNLKIDPYGFREYDARWLYEKDINTQGIENLGKGLGTQIINHTKKNNPRVVVGHDYRSYSEEIKSALKKGLISTGCYVEDVGLSLSPMVYFAQFNLNTDAVAMVTASHNENGLEPGNRHRAGNVHCGHDSARPALAAARGDGLRATCSRRC